MKILVTGASGFIGGYVAKELAKNSCYSIIATGRSFTSIFDTQSNVRFIKADLSQHFPEISCDVCIHCAGLADDKASFEDFERNNVEATKLLLNSLKNCKTFIHISSSSVYNFSDEYIKKENDANMNSNISPYGLSKLKSEELVKNSYIPSLYILRPRAVYGPGDRVLLPRILKLIKKNKVLAPGLLKVRTNLTHIQNLYEAVEKSLMQSANSIHIFNVADDCIYNLNEVIGEIAYQKYGHKNFLNIPIWLIKIFISVQSLFRLKSVITHQSLLYITQNSVLCVDKAKEVIHYSGTHSFFDSIHQLKLTEVN
jgi:nucleoside-diphosphate-sugar epimerase